MPRLTTKKFTATNDAGMREGFDVVVNVNVEGKFYCKAPELLGDLFPILDKEGRLWADSLDELCDYIYVKLRDYMQPQVTTENVIHFNIESKISFAEDSDGNIHACGYSVEDAERVNDEMYGDINATKSSAGGYVLRIGAKALTKTTTSWGEHKKVTYSRFYDGGSHLHGGTPAADLNMWNSFHLDDPPHCREIPYSDEAAIFFSDMMHGMAELSRLIQSHTFDGEKLQQLIETRSTHLLPYLGKYHE